MNCDSVAQWRAVLNRDRNADGQFYYAVRSTGIYCRPSCPSRRPRPESVSYFQSCVDAESAGFRACLRCKPHETARHIAAVTACCRYMESHFDEPITLETLAAEVEMSASHLQKVFKQAVGITPREYADACRTEAFRNALLQGRPVVEALIEAGFGSTSRAYEGANRRLGMSPGSVRKGGVQMEIHYATTSTKLGALLVASTEKGICSVTLGDNAHDLVADFRNEYPAAEIREDKSGLESTLWALVQHIEGNLPALDLPTDVRATAFQRRVWQELQRIPFGETRSYAEIAKAIGKPSAARAVARACATNPTALIVPCHRVVRTGGELSGYRWEVERKRELLRREKAIR
ncbi:MAG: bifunctional DNA-binding transcriptional regulator/O6-methylguanine-DNA methyltransferase Ada [Chthonomonadales bacterium]